MAGDWIKMRSDLFTHPKVVRIASATKADRLRTVGGLMSVWCLFDAHSEDGYLDGYTLQTVDDLIGWGGFAEAMKSVGWITETTQGLELPEFDTHNGQSAKRRAQDADRKRAGRASASDADKKRTREEKRREEIELLSTTEVVLVASNADDEADRPIAAQCPHKDIIDAYHEHLPMCPRIRDWTPARQTTLRARWNEDKTRQTVDYWKRLFAYVSESQFLTGRTSSRDGRPFFASLEWILKPENFAKIREGRYHKEAA